MRFSPRTVGSPRLTRAVGSLRAAVVNQTARRSFSTTAEPATAVAWPPNYTNSVMTVSISSRPENSPPADERSRPATARPATAQPAAGPRQDSWHRPSSARTPPTQRWSQTTHRFADHAAPPACISSAGLAAAARVSAYAERAAAFGAIASVVSARQRPSVPVPTRAGDAETPRGAAAGLSSPAPPLEFESRSRRGGPCVSRSESRASQAYAEGPVRRFDLTLPVRHGIQAAPQPAHPLPLRLVSRRGRDVGQDSGEPPADWAARLSEFEVARTLALARGDDTKILSQCTPPCSEPSAGSPHSPRGMGSRRAV